MKKIVEKKDYIKPALDVRMASFSALAVNSPDSSDAKRMGWDDGTADYQDEDGFDW